MSGYPVSSPRPFCEVTGQVYKISTTCFEARDPTTKDEIDSTVLYAIGMAKVATAKYPVEVESIPNSILPYDEPLYPIPVGASVYYLIMIAWMSTFYFTYLGRKVLSGVKKKMDLHPETEKFPSLPLYWIQQSKREAELRREVRNTWAWLARRYLLSPNDPLLDNVDQVLGLVNWHDFEVSRTTWSLIKVVLTVNSLYVKVKRNRTQQSKFFEIVKDISLAKRKSMEDDPVQTTRVILVDDEDEYNQPGFYTKPKKEEPPSLTSIASAPKPVRRASVDTVKSSISSVMHDKYGLATLLQNTSSGGFKIGGTHSQQMSPLPGKHSSFDSKKHKGQKSSHQRTSISPKPILSKHGAGSTKSKTTSQSSGKKGKAKKSVHIGETIMATSFENVPMTAQPEEGEAMIDSTGGGAQALRGDADNADVETTPAAAEIPTTPTPTDEFTTSAGDDTGNADNMLKQRRKMHKKKKKN